MGGGWALTSRGDLLERLGRAFADGSLGGVVLSGPAGVGKTRLGDEALRVATGVPTARAVGHAATRVIPLGALAPLMPASLVRDIGVGDDDRARLFHDGRLSLAELAGGRRLLLLLDDIDQLDDTSLALLLPLTVERTIFLVATLRTGQRRPDVVESLLKDGHLEQWEVPPLAPDQVATLLHRVLDGPVDSAAVERLAAASQGNLQTLREVVRRARDDGSLQHEGGMWRLTALPVPTGLEDLIAAHLAEADDDEREVFDLLAIAGSLGLADLEPVLDRRRLEALEERGFIAVTVDRRRVQVALAHPLYGEVLRRQLSPLREHRLMRELADRIEASGARRREDVTRMALWRLEAGGDIDADVLLSAGRLALIGREADLATRFGEAAAERGAAHDAARIAVEAALLTADLPGAERAVLAVWSDRDLPDEHRAHLCRRLVAARYARADLDGALAAVDEAAALVTDSGARELILAQRALLLAYTGRPADVLAVLDEIPDADDPRVRTELATARSHAHVMMGRFSAGAEAARDAAAAEREIPAWIASGSNARDVVNEAHALTYGGQLAEAQALLSSAISAAHAAGAGATTGWLEMVFGQLERDAGDGRATLAHFEAARTLGAASGHQGAIAFGELGCAQGHLLLGDVDAAAEALRRADAAGPCHLSGGELLRSRTRAGVAAARGDLVEARRLLDEAADDARSVGFLVVEVGLRHDVVRTGAPEAVVGRLTELADEVEGPFAAIAANHARAAIDQDRDAYAELADQAEAAGFLVVAAEIAAELADLHRRARDQRAATAADQQVARLVRQTGARTMGLRRGAGIEPLTGREREVALLAAAGASSKDIAEQLFLSSRTVDTHLARVYRKLGISSRDQLATALDHTPPETV